MPSNDARYENAEQDIWQHTVNNDDYPDCWVFEDERFYLQNGDDETYLKFLCEVFHPAVRYEKGYWKEFLTEINYCKMMDMSFILRKKYLTVMFIDGGYFRERKAHCLFHILKEMKKI